MNFSRFKSASKWDMKECMTKTGYVSDHSAEYAAEAIESRFYVFKREEYYKPKFYWRISWPFFAALFIILVIISPVKWFITGDWYWDFHSVPMRLYHGWRDKLGL